MKVEMEATDYGCPAIDAPTRLFKVTTEDGVTHVMAVALVFSPESTEGPSKIFAEGCGVPTILHPAQVYGTLLGTPPGVSKQ